MFSFTAERMLTIAGALEDGKLSDETRWLYERVVQLERLVSSLRRDDATERVHEVVKENNWLREVIARAAQDLERLGNEPGRSQEASDVLRVRAALMNAQARDGAPEGWREHETNGAE
jgi:hypothetical protein